MDNKAINALLTQFDDIYDNSFNSIYKQINDSRKSYKHVTSKTQSKLKASVTKSLTDFQSKYIATLQTSSYTIYNSTIDRFQKDSGIEIDSDTKLSIQKTIDKYTKEQEFYIKNQVLKMKKDIQYALREDVVLVSRNAVVKNMSRKDAYKDFKEDLLIRDIKSKFVDKLGRKYDSRIYYEMLSKTIINEIRNTTYAELSVKYGYDLVKISSHLAKDACRKWEGKTLSLTGATKGYISIAQAKATRQIFHPRCKHYYTVVTREDS